MTPPQPAPTPRTRKLRQLPRPVAAFAIKAAINDPAAEAFAFPAHKTMYAGKTIAAGDRVSRVVDREEPELIMPGRLGSDDQRRLTDGRD